MNSSFKGSNISDTARKDKFQEVVNYENIDDINLYQQTEMWIQKELQKKIQESENNYMKLQENAQQKQQAQNLMKLQPCTKEESNDT